MLEYLKKKLVLALCLFWHDPPDDVFLSAAELECKNEVIENLSNLALRESKEVI